MDAYSYNDHGVFTGVSECQLDPMATKRLGKPKYLIPASSTTIAPPPFDPEKQRAIWDGAEWVVEDKPAGPEPPAPAPEPEETYTADDLFAALLDLTKKEETK